MQIHVWCQACGVIKHGAKEWPDKCDHCAAVDKLFYTTPTSAFGDWRPVVDAQSGSQVGAGEDSSFYPPGHVPAYDW